MLRNHNVLVLTDDEYAHVLAALGRVDDPGGFPNALEFYESLVKGANARVDEKFIRYYNQMTFSGTRSHKLGRKREESLHNPRD